MTNYLARLFYLGDNYYGSQKQPGFKTVQGELIDAIETWSNENHSSRTIQMSGRTDRGVHALGQVVMITSEKPLTVDGINKFLPDDIILWARAKAPEGFRPRSSPLLRHYRYFLGDEWKELDIGRVRHAISKLAGSRDFGMLSKPDERRNTVTTVLNMYIENISGVSFLDVIGTSFLWKFVRKVVTLLMEIGLGTLDSGVINEITHGVKRTIRSGIEPAAPENLLLLETIVPVRFIPSKYGLRKIQKILNDRFNYHLHSMNAFRGIINFFSSSVMPYQSLTSLNNHLQD
ncbi:tRNA pseudouridine(38-40) synthase TruA [Candidatus Thorarchaeota archaeon]|nr:MAG: tRNA pseudouridine(38-40) synthase TruA [Candidatus Thorarchaeota archaeon]